MPKRTDWVWVDKNNEFGVGDNGVLINKNINYSKKGNDIDYPIYVRISGNRGTCVVS